jgi:hypothetical protein
VLFQVALGPLHIDVLIGRKLRTDPIIGSGAGLDILAIPELKSAFQILADQAIHGYASSLSADARAAMDVVPSQLRIEDLLLGAKPVLFVLAGFTTTVFIQFIGPLSDHVV